MVYRDDRRFLSLQCSIIVSGLCKRAEKSGFHKFYIFFNFENSALGSLDRKGVGETLGKLCEIARRQDTRGVGYADWYANVLN